MSLRLKLLLLGLATLILPWGGCQYAREMESALREGEQNSLQAVSQTIAASLQGRTDLLYREALPPPDAPDAPAAPVSPGADPVRAFLNPGPYDLKPLALTAAPLLDRARRVRPASRPHRAASPRRLAADGPWLSHRAARADGDARERVRRAGGRSRCARRGPGELRHAGQRRPAHPRPVDRGRSGARLLPHAIHAAGAQARGHDTLGPGAGARGRTRAGDGTRLRSPDTRAALPALRRPPRRAAAARIPGPHLRPRPQDAHRPARGHADGDRLDPPARPRPDAHAQLQPEHQRRGGDGDVRVRRVAGGTPLAAAAGERIGPDALWLGHQLSRNRLARRAGRCRAQLLDAPAAPQRVHQLPAHPRRQAGARDPHPAHHRALLAR